jgi:arginase family enzyme
MINIEDLINHLDIDVVAVLGVPFDENSSFMRGSAMAPQRILEVMHSGGGNLCVEDGFELAKD